jgi:hypothetical protein
MTVLEVWFKKRFGKNPIDDPIYFKDWERRYQNGIEYFIGCMDKESKRIWIMVVLYNIEKEGELK